MAYKRRLRSRDTFWVTRKLVRIGRIGFFTASLFEKWAATHLAETLLRLQRLDRTQTHRETPLHAPESGEARFGDAPGTLALEQLPRLLPGRGRSGTSQRAGCAQDERFDLRPRNRQSNGVEGSAGHFSKTARSGAPPSDFGTRSKTNPRYTSLLKWPTRQMSCPTLRAFNKTQLFRLSKRHVDTG